MKKLMIAMMVVFSAAICRANVAPDAEEEDTAGTCWRLTLGGFARGGMKAEIEGLKPKHVEGYGADLDALIKVYDKGDINVWTGVGFSWMPNQTIMTVRTPLAPGQDKEQMQIQYGELRLLLVPEWQATERLALGVRLGAALDWIGGKTKWETSVPAIPPIPTYYDTGSESYSNFAVQGIAGLQATYMFTDCLGVYANVDTRMGKDVSFKKGGERIARLDMSGWYVGAGLVLAF